MNNPVKVELRTPHQGASNKAAFLLERFSGKTEFPANQDRVFVFNIAVDGTQVDALEKLAKTRFSADDDVKLTVNGQAVELFPTATL